MVSKGGSRKLLRAAASRRRSLDHGPRTAWLLLAAILASSVALAQPVTVGPISFDEPEFPESFSDLDLVTLGGTPIPRVSFRYAQGLVIDDSWTAYLEDAEIDSPMQGRYLAAPNFGVLRLELGGDATRLSFDFFLLASPSESVVASHGVEVRLYGASGALVGHGSAENIFDGEAFGASLDVSSGQPFRAAEISAFFTVPAQIVGLLLDNLTVTLVPDATPPVELGPEKLISTGGALPVVATDPAGRRAVAWEEGAGGSREIFAQLFDADGQALGEEFRVNAGSSDDDVAPSIAFDADGELVVAWLRETPGAASAGAAGTILGRRFDPASGTPLGGESVIAQGAAAPPTVGASAGGDAVVTWPAGANVLGRRFGRQGAPLGNAFEVSASPAAASVRVATSPAGDFVVVWEGSASAAETAPGSASAATGTILGRFFDANTGPKGEVMTLSPPGVSASAPAAAADATGNVVVVWQQAAAGGSNVMARRFTRAGGARGDAFRVHDSAAVEQTAPSVAVNAAGDIVVAWESAPAGSGGSASAAATSVVGRVFDGSSLAAGDEVEVAVAEGGAAPASPQVTIDDRDDATVVYERKTSGGGEAGLFSRKLSATLPPAPCVAGDTTLCLAGGRFEVRVTWRDFSGNSGVASAESLTSDTGYFWFFDPANVEIVLKVLDARAVNDFFWVFYGALSNVEYTIAVHDTVTGIGKTYFNPAGSFGSAGDTAAIPGSAVFEPWRETDAARFDPWSSGVERNAAAACTGACTVACTADDETLCLQQSRFAASITWKDFDGQGGVGQAVPLSGDTGYFWFFDPANVEVVVKVLDGRSFNNQFWVFYGALSNVEFTLTVTDSVTGATKTYVNPLGEFASVGDTAALPGS